MSIQSQDYSVVCSNMNTKYRMKATDVALYFQDCFARYAAKNGFAPFDLAKRNITLFITDYDIELTEDLPFWSEAFTVHTSIAEITRLKLIVEGEFLHKSKIFAKGRMTWVLFNTEKGRLLPTSTLFDSSYPRKSLIKTPLNAYDKMNPKEILRDLKHVVNSTDLDFNEHVNNMTYVNNALATASKEFLAKHYIQRLTVKFMQQAFLGDELSVTSYSMDTPNVFSSQIRVGEKDICQILSVWHKRMNSQEIADYPLALRLPS